MAREYSLDANNQPVRDDNAWQWIRENPYRKVIGLTQFPDGSRVSTVFLVMDHGWEGGPPVLWETMVFGKTPHPEYTEDFQDRYTSHRDAIAGHLAVVKAILSCAEIGAANAKRD